MRMGMDDPDGFPAAAVRVAGWIILLQGQASLIGFLREPFVPPVDTNTQGIAADFLPSALCIRKDANQDPRISIAIDGMRGAYVWQRDRITLAFGKSRQIFASLFS